MGQFSNPPFAPFLPQGKGCPYDSQKRNPFNAPPIVAKKKTSKPPQILDVGAIGRSPRPTQKNTPSPEFHPEAASGPNPPGPKFKCGLPWGPGPEPGEFHLLEGAYYPFTKKKKLNITGAGPLPRGGGGKHQKTLAPTDLAGGRPNSQVGLAFGLWRGSCSPPKPRAGTGFTKNKTDRRSQNTHKERRYVRLVNPGAPFRPAWLREGYPVPVLRSLHGA